MKFFSLLGNATPFLRRTIMAGLFLAVCLAVIYAHTVVTLAGDDYKGPLMPLDRLFDLLLVGLLLGVGSCVGRTISRRLGLIFASGAEEISFSVMAGTGFIGLAILGLGLAGLLKPLPVAALFLALAAFTHQEGMRLCQMARQGLRSISKTWWRMLGTLLVGLFAAILILRAAVPPHVFDEVIYHLAATKRFVEGGRIFPLYDISVGNMPFLIHMIYAVCLLAKADIAARLFSLAMGFVAALGLYGFCTRFLTPRVGIISLIGFFGAGMVVEVAATTRIDVTLAGVLFLATYGMMIHLDTQQKGWLYMSAMLCGFALGIKLTAGLWIALIAIMYLVENFFKRTQPFVHVLKHGAVFALIVAVIASPWLIKNWVWFHNPVYPFITGEVAEYGPSGIRYFGGEDENKLNAHFEAAHRAIPTVVASQEQTLASYASIRPEHHPLRFWEYFTRPDDFNMAERFQFPNYLFLIAPLSVLLTTNRWALWLALLSVAFFVGVASSTWIGRYLLPVYPPLTVLSAYSLTVLSEWPRPYFPLIAKVFPVLIIVSMLSIVAIFSTKISIQTHNLDFVRGALSRHEFLSRAGFWVDYYPSTNFINRHLPGDAKVMLLGVQPSYYLRPGHLADPAWDATEWRRLLIRNPSMTEVDKDLKRQGVTHILYNPEIFNFIAYTGRSGSGGVDAMQPTEMQSQGPDYKEQLRNWATFELYRREFLVPIYFDKNGFAIYQLRAGETKVEAP